MQTGINDTDSGCHAGMLHTMTDVNRRRQAVQIVTTCFVIVTEHPVKLSEQLNVCEILKST